MDRKDMIEKAALIGVNARELCAPNEWRSIKEAMLDEYGIRLEPGDLPEIMYRVNELWRARQKDAGVNPRYWAS